jgi:hypothetical protein
MCEPRLTLLDEWLEAIDELMAYYRIKRREGEKLRFLSSPCPLCNVHKREIEIQLRREEQASDDCICPWFVFHKQERFQDCCAVRKYTIKSNLARLSKWKKRIEEMKG